MDNLPDWHELLPPDDPSPAQPLEPDDAFVPYDGDDPDPLNGEPVQLGCIIPQGDYYYAYNSDVTALIGQFATEQEAEQAIIDYHNASESD